MIVLVGFMGAGKTTAGRLLAESLGVPFVDVDEAIVAVQGRSVADIFAADGEAGFRRIEADRIAELLGGEEAVVALGGGALGTPAVREAVTGHRVVLLDVPLAEALARVGGDQERPMLARPDLAEVYAGRQRDYRDAASVVVRWPDARPPRSPRTCWRRSPTFLESGLEERASASRRASARGRAGRGRVGRMDVLVINGPNLNTLGTREPEIYGSTTLADIEDGLRAQAEAAGLSLDAFQSNHEGEIIDRLHAARTDGTRFVIINPGAFTHTSVAIRDAFAAVAIPFCEVHISNVHAREEFRRHSYLSDLAVGVLTGFGGFGYTMAMSYVIDRLKEN